MSMPMPRLLAQAAVIAAAAAFIGFFSTAPRYTSLPENEAMIRLSFSHGAPRSNCRMLTAAERASLPPNMRITAECPRGRPSVHLRFELNGSPMLDEMLPPSGLAGDGNSRIYRNFLVPPGPHRLHLAMADTPRRDGFDTEREFDISLKPRQNVVVDYDARSGFRLR